MVFGTSLRVPGNFFHSSPMNQWPEPGCYANRLSLHMSRLRPVPIRLANKPDFVPSDLRTCSHVFLRLDAFRRPLQPVYDGPFRVVNRGEKNFTIITIISMPAYLDSGKSVSPKFPATSVPLETNGPSCGFSPSPTSISLLNLPDPHYTTRSGRRVKFPDYLQVS